ncbi:MAG: uroporphyrinogen decarboxylase family protein [Treponema sp.]|nr:uroporphyrinogen decarboxylase family protein [Treponema sp.]
MNMQKWKENMIAASKKKALPILTFPYAQLMGITINELIASSELQAKLIVRGSRSTDSAAALSMMDLSVEAEAFGSEIRKSDHEVPTVVGHIIKNIDDAEKLEIPDTAAGRTGTYIKAIGIASGEIKDKPLLAGVIGPFSLAGRLMDMSEIMVNCIEDPDYVIKTLEKTSEFIINYIMGFKKAGANGVVMAEPAAGLLSPGLVNEFSSEFIKKIVEQVKDENFLFFYHNCGPYTPLMLPSLAGINADAYHFGDAVKMKQILEGMPDNVLVLGNISPASQFLKGTPESTYNATADLLNECSVHKNFIISSGCDIPPMSPWANIESFFKAVKDFYK